MEYIRSAGRRSGSQAPGNLRQVRSVRGLRSTEGSTIQSSAEFSRTALKRRPLALYKGETDAMGERTRENRFRETVPS